jgi:RNA-binding protein
MSSEKRKQLKAKAHNIKPVVTIGQNGLTEPVLKEIDLALHAHELIKIKTPAGDSKQRRELCTTVCEQLSAQEIQIIGRNITLYREQTE